VSTHRPRVPVTATLALLSVLFLAACAGEQDQVAGLTTTCVMINVGLDRVATDGCDRVFDAPYVRHLTIGLPPRNICVAGGLPCALADKKPPSGG